MYVKRHSEETLKVLATAFVLKCLSRGVTATTLYTRVIRVGICPQTSNSNTKFISQRNNIFSGILQTSTSVVNHCVIPQEKEYLHVACNVLVKVTVTVMLTACLLLAHHKFKTNLQCEYNFDYQYYLRR